MNLKKRFYISKYEVEGLLPNGLNKKVIGLMKDKLGRKIMAELVGFIPKTYSYLKDNGRCDKS